MKKNISADAQLKEVKTAGYKFSKREKNTNRSAGLHDKKNDLAEGEARVKRRKPLALKHVRRMRKAAAALACVTVVASVGAIGAGAFLGDEGTSYTGYKTVCYELPDNAGSPMDYTIVQNVGFMNYVLQRQSHWSSEMSSDVNAMGFDQHVETYKQYYNGILISCDIADGFSHKATQYCVNSDKGVIMWRPAVGKFDKMNSEWSTDKASKTDVEKFIEWRGFPPSEFSVYVLNEKTIKNAEEYAVTQNSEGNFEMTLELNVGLSSAEAEFAADCYYVKQMKATGDLPSLPSIKKTSLTYVFDKDWRVLSFEINDEYTAMGAIPCSSKTNVTYDYGEENAKNSFYEDYFKKYEDIASSGIVEEAPSAATYLGAAFGSVLTDGGVFKVDLAIDNLELNGVAYVGMKNKKLTDLCVKLGDISVFMDSENVLYVSDGSAKYKLNAGALFAPAEQTKAAGGSFSLDTDALMQQIMNGKFTVGENSTLLETVLDILGLKINLSFNFIPGEGTVALDYCAAEIPVGDKLIKAELRFGTEGDIPAKPADISGYTDILNDGLTVDIDASLGGLKLDGLAHIAMRAGEFKGIYAELGDLSVYYDYSADMLGLSDGKVNYKFGLSALKNGGADLSSFFVGADINGVISQIIHNLSAGDGKINTQAGLEVLGQTVTAALGVRLAGGIKIDASVNAFGQDINVSLALVNADVTLPDLSKYTDVLNEGLTLGLNIKLDKLDLNGVAHIVLKDGKFDGLRAEFGGFGIYYYEGNLYVTDGTVKYMIPSSVFGGANGTSTADSGLGKIIEEIVSALTFANDGVSTKISSELFGKAITAEIKVNLFGGFSVDADIKVKDFVESGNASKPSDLGISLVAGFTNEKVDLPDDLGEYVDILNGEITVDASLTLDKADLSGKITVALNRGKLKSVRAVFGDLRVDFEADSQILYIAVGSTKAFVNMSQIPFGTADMSAAFGGSLVEIFGGDASKLVCELLSNLSAGLREISTGANINVLNSVIPANLTLVLPAEGESTKIKADVMLFGVSIKAAVNLTADSLPELSVGEKEGYYDALKQPFEVLNAAVGGRITANVTGTLYDYSNDYLSSSRLKYEFEASLEYDSGKTYISGGENAVNPLYLRFNLALTAKNVKDDSLYLDLLVMDANPVSTDGNGKTQGGYFTDGVMDVYVSLSNRAGGTPLKLYADMNEILTLVSMVGAAANLDSISFENNAQLTEAVNKISQLIDEHLIDKYISHTKDQFSSLGDSLIPQILGKSLNEFINELFSGFATVKEDGGEKLDLSKTYIDSVTYGDNTLNIVLNSSAIYNTPFEKEDYLNVVISKDVLENGVNRLGGIELNNVYFGENNENSLDMNLLLNYGEIEKPDNSSGLSGYLNAYGADTLLKALANSASHETGLNDDGSKNYELNHTYLLSGNIGADIKVSWLFNASLVNLNLDVKTLKVVIKEDNSVYADAHIVYNYNATVKKGNGELYLSIMNDMAFIKRVIGGAEETRVMPVSAFLGDLLNQIDWMFKFDGLLEQISGLIPEGSGGANLENKDYGELLDYVLPVYKFTESGNSACWEIKIGGTNRILGDIIGKEIDDIPVKFNAVKNDGLYTVTGLEVPKSMLNLGGGAKVYLNANFTYDNPHEVLADGKEDTSEDLINGALPELKNNGWHQVLGGESFQEIKAKTDWDLLLKETGKTYLDFNNSPLAIAYINFEYAADTDNSSFIGFGERQLVLYNTSTNTVYTKISVPELPKGLDTENRKLDWNYGLIVKDEDNVVCRAEFMNTYKVTVESSVKINGDYSEGEDGIFRKTEEKAYKVIYLKKDILFTDENGVTYGLLGYTLKGSDVLVNFDYTGTDADGDACFAAIVDKDETYVAVWDIFYEVRFLIPERDGLPEEEITVHYYAGEKLSDRLPEIPEFKGHTGRWVYTDVTVNPDMTAEQRVIRAEYSVNNYTVTVCGSQNAEGFVEDGSGAFVNAFTADYGAQITLEPVKPVSNGFIFGGYYDNPEFKGEPITAFTLENDVTYYINWIGKTVNVTYKSDLPFASGKTENGLCTLNASYRYGVEENLLGFSDSQNILLGWFMESAGEDGSVSYIYIKDIAALKEVLLSSLADKDGVSVTLCAVWIDSLEVEITKAERKFQLIQQSWTIEGNYSGAQYASAMSERVAVAAGVRRVAEYRIELSKKLTGSGVDALTGFAELNGNTFGIKNKGCANSCTEGGARVKVSFNLGNENIILLEKANYKQI